MAVNSGKNHTTRKAIGYCRFVVQMTALALTIAGMSALVRNMGLPKWAFISAVILTGMFFCGWMCPFGTIQEWLRRAGKRLTGRTLRVPERIDRYLRLSRYAILPLEAVVFFSAFDSRRAFAMAMAGHTVETAAYVILGVMLALSLFMDRPFCKYLCSFGAVYGLSSIFRLITIKRNGEKCINCGKCNRTCQMGVQVSKAHNVRDPHCIQCGKCLAACPVPGALQAGITLPCLDDARAASEKYFPKNTAHEKKNQESKNAA